jgi:hypothetical protein
VSSIIGRGLRSHEKCSSRTDTSHSKYRVGTGRKSEIIIGIESSIIEGEGRISIYSRGRIIGDRTDSGYSIRGGSESSLICPEIDRTSRDRTIRTRISLEPEIFSRHSSRISHWSSSDDRIGREGGIISRIRVRWIGE